MRVVMVLVGIGLVATATLLEAAGILHAANVGVDVNDNFYDDGDGSTLPPETTTITVGDTVTWTWVGSNGHTVTADDDSFDSGNPSQTSGTFVLTFDSAGTFPYYCVNHGLPGGSGMAGTIIVQEAPTATNTTAPTATNTSTPTDTPTGTVTPATATATATPSPSATIAPATATVATTVPVIATQPAGGAGAGFGAPRVGDGPADTGAGSTHVLSAALGIVGAMMLAGAAVMRRRQL